MFPGIPCIVFLLSLIHAISKLLGSGEIHGRNDNDFVGIQFQLENSTILDNLAAPWNLTVLIDPKNATTCPPEWISEDELPNIPELWCDRNRTTISCNEDDTGCMEEIITERFYEGCDKEADLQRPKQTKDCGPLNGKEWITHFIICYESQLDPVNLKGFKPHFSLTNNNGNAWLAKFCNSGGYRAVQHGIMLELSILMNEQLGRREINAKVFFSFSEKIISMPSINQNSETNETALNYTFVFDSDNDHTMLVDPLDKMHNDSPNEGPLLADGQLALQKIAGLWLTLLDIGKDASSPRLILHQNSCGNYSKIVLLNESVHLKEKNVSDQCKKLKRKREKEDEERKRDEEKYREIDREVKEELKEVAKIMDKVNSVQRACHAPPDSNVPNPPPPPEIIDTINAPEMLFYSKEKVLELLDQYCRECELQIDRKIYSENCKLEIKERIKKRQISEILFNQYKDLEHYEWSEKYWNPEGFPIPYTHDRHDNKTWIANIKMGIQTIIDSTCITFRYFPSEEQATDTSYIRFYDLNGCGTNLGRKKGVNLIVISSSLPCGAMDLSMNKFGVIAMKIFGYVMKSYIMAENNSLFGFPYDFGSVMHYGPRHFQKKEMKSEGYQIVAKERAYQQTFGQRSTLSFKDAKLLNRVYCNAVCPIKLLCANGGYTDPKDCLKCRCPIGFTGISCDRLERGDPKCHSGRYYADTVVKFIESSNVMDGAKTCFWSIKTLQIKQSLVIRIIILLNFTCNEPCDEDNYLEVHMQTDRTSRGTRICCASTLPHTFTLESGIDALVSLKRRDNSQQFQLTYETPDAILPEKEKPVADDFMCECTQAYNPWHKPGDPHVVPMNSLYWKIGIKSRSDLIINGKYRFHTQNGSAWFDRFCTVNVESFTAYGTWQEPTSGKWIRLDDIVAESCVTDYLASGCEEMSNIWKKFAACLVADKEKAENCPSAENFRHEKCGIGGSGTRIPIEQTNPF